MYRLPAVHKETESESESETGSEADVSDGNVESNDDVDLSDLVSDAQILLTSLWMVLILMLKAPVMSLWMVLFQMQKM